MNFIVNAYDYKDDESLKRRMNAREAHMENIKVMHSKGQILMACAMLNDKGQMCGSTMILNMENEEQVNQYLDKEAYILGKVWERVEVSPCKIPALFL